MAVYSADSEEPENLGEVASLLLNENDRVTGIVVSVGGFLGIGAKSVALDWESVELRQWDEITRVAVVSMSLEELEEAPEFMTQAEIRAEEEAERARRELQQQQQEGTTGTLQ